MATQAAENLEDLTTCTVCLETFTRPKMLPCQHSYCYACLMLLGKDKSTITCPYCQKEHLIPDSGISGFNDNLLLNNLVGISLPRMEICTDCKQNTSTDHACEHCQRKLCSPCLVEHTKLAEQLSFSLNQLNEDLQSTPTSQDQKEKFEKFKTNLEAQQEKINGAVRAEAVKKLIEVKILLEEAEFMDKIIQMVIELYRILTREDRESSSGSHVSELAEKVGECTTADSLNDFKNTLADSKTFLRLIRTKDEEFKFRYSTSPQDGPGQLQFGQAVVNVRGKYQIQNIVDRILQFVQDSAAILHEHVTPTCQPRSDHVVLPAPTRSTADAKTETEERFLVPETEKKATDERNKSSTASANVASYPDQAAIDNLAPAATEQATSSEPTRGQKYSQNQLPRNVGYIGKGETGVGVIGQGESVEIKNKLYRPYGCAYHVERDEIFVADWGHNRIMVYRADGKGARVFYTGVNSEEVAISGDGKHVYIATAQSLIKVTTDGRHVKTIKRFSLGDIKCCRSVVCYREFTVVVDSNHKCVIVFNDRDEEIRSFGREHLRDPRSVTVSEDESFYVTDWGDSCVKVFDRAGQYTETFAKTRRMSGGIWGIAVDGDGNVCVSRHASDRIEVYSARRELMTTISGPRETPGRLRCPTRLCLTPDGRIIVAEYGGHRVQIF